MNKIYLRLQSRWRLFQNRSNDIICFFSSMIKRKENKKENKIHSTFLPHVLEPLMLRETFAGGRPVVWQLVSAVQAGAVEQPTCLAQCLSGGNLFVTQCDAGEQKSIPHQSGCEAGNLSSRLQCSARTAHAVNRSQNSVIQNITVFFFFKCIAAQ